MLLDNMWEEGVIVRSSKRLNAKEHVMHAHTQLAFADPREDPTVRGDNMSPV